MQFVVGSDRIASSAVASVSLERQIAAPPETVFDVLVDHRGYANLTLMRRSELEREGEPAPNGVGAIRVLHAIGPPLREEVLTYEPPTRFSYKVLSGAPIRDHVGTVELSPTNGGTKVVYVVRMIPTVPVVGGAVVGVVKLGIKQLLNGIAAESERRVAAG
jgi:uncharacterized protein YndB with AHSA1/START domain